MWRDEDAIAGRVDEMNRDEPGAGKLLGPCTDATEMSGVADPDSGEAAGPAAFGKQRHRLARDHLPVTEPPVDDKERAAINNDVGMPVGENLAGSQPG